MCRIYIEAYMEERRNRNGAKYLQEEEEDEEDEDTKFRSITYKQVSIRTNSPQCVSVSSL